MTQLVDKTGIPVVTTLMGKGAISSCHPLYLGNVGIHGGYAPNVAITDCDVMISIGTVSMTVLLAIEYICTKLQNCTY